MPTTTYENSIISKEDADFANGLQLAENYVKKFYLDQLSRYEVKKISRGIIEKSEDKENIKLYNINRLVFDKNESVQDRLNNVYSSMHSLNLSVLFLIVSNGENLNLYIGTKTISDNFADNQDLAHAFEKTFQGNFPGSQLSLVSNDKCDELLNSIFPKNGFNAVTSLTSLPSIKNSNAKNTEYVQGLEKFIETMQGQEYAVLIISDPVSGGRIEEVKHGYEELYTELMPLAGYDLTTGINKGVSLSVTETEGFTETIGTSIAKTQSFTKGSGITKSESTTNTFGINAGVSGNYSEMEQTTSIFKEGGPLKRFKKKLKVFKDGGTIASAIASGVTQTIGGTLGLSASQARTHGTAISENESKQYGLQRSHQESHSDTHQKSQQSGTNEGSSVSTMVKCENKSIKVLLECIDDHLKRLKECENYGMWSSAAYFISPSKENSIIAASAYKGIINGEGTSLEASCMNTWFNDDNTKLIHEYLRYFTHPMFYDPDYLIDLYSKVGVTASTMLSTKELSIQCSVPYKSVTDVSVREMARFGIDVIRPGYKDDYVDLGLIYHMGKEYHDYNVPLTVNSLREHTFITGSTGSGKSNTVYQMINQLKEKNIPALIIEPAKGEYKQIFGDGFHVFGTNPSVTELLRINPFRFEDGIHVLEHIDRLIDIFNVCWPMYAAMPAILKEAVEDAYITAGWNLNTSVCSEPLLYPNFKDLLNSLRKVIGSSDYSQEVKDNYTGSLITRVKSLTNGLNGQIFTCDEIDNKTLFEDNTIVDLSRVGSSETKSMIMGIIVMRLQERRMVQEGINLPLRHITVLEEAHNLLKRTSIEQSDETSNLLGKSVEMISNAIAEMRTYGEGFVIVDQAPGLLDMSVIRNTNTKIIMHLPDFSDRELVGKSAGLNDDQIIELAKLPTGVAAVYQNRWIEPVLCKVEYYNASPKPYYKKRHKEVDPMSNIEFANGRIAQYLVSTITDEQALTDVVTLNNWLIHSNTESNKKIRLFKILSGKNHPDKEKIEEIISDLVDPSKDILDRTVESTSPEEWNEAIIDRFSIDKSGFTDNSIYHILECFIHHRMMERNDEESFLKWQNHRKMI